MVVAFLFLFLSAVIIPEGGIVQGRGKKRGGRSSRKNKNRSGSDATRGGTPPPPPPPGSPPSRSRKKSTSAGADSSAGNGGGLNEGKQVNLDALSIEPRSVDFTERPACIPVVQTLTLTHEETYAVDGDLKLYTISSDNAQFHPAMFKQQSLSPGKSTSFQVIFLPRTVGNTDATLTIKTSIGRYEIAVHGTGVENPYGLTAFVGAKVPAGVHYNPPIRINNPGDKVLRIKEVFTTEGFLHLSLPGNEDDGAGGGSGSGVEKYSPTVSHKAGAGAQAKGGAGMWNIQPQGTKEIIRLSFKSHISGRYQGYVHVKTSRENMVLPVQVTVLSGGIHTTPESLDFGVITKADSIETRSISMLNTGADPVVIVGAFLSTVYGGSGSGRNAGRRSGKSKSSNWKKTNTKLWFNDKKPLAVGVEVPGVVSLSIKGKDEGVYSGNVIILTNDTNPAQARVEVAYKVNIIHGSLKVHGGFNNFPLLGWRKQSDPSCVRTQASLTSGATGTSCLEDGHRHIFHKIPVTSEFKISVRIAKISVPSNSRFEIKNGGELVDLVLSPGENTTVNVLYSTLEARGELSTTYMRVETNISTIDIPLNVYHGQLNVSWAVLGDKSYDGEGTSLKTETEKNGDSTVQETAMINMGSFAKNSSRFAVLRLTNYNPIPILVSEILSGNPGVDLSHLGSYQVLSVAETTKSGAAASANFTQRKHTVKRLSDPAMGARHERDGGLVKEEHWLGDDEESRNASAVRTVCYASHCTKSEHEDVRKTLSGAGTYRKQWNHAIDSLNMERCRQSRGEWAWTCESPASLNISEDVGHKLDSSEIAHLVAELGRREEFELFGSANFTYFTNTRFGRTAKFDKHSSWGDRVVRPLESALYLVRLRPDLQSAGGNKRKRNVPSVVIDTSLHQKISLAFDYKHKAGSVRISPGAYHFDSNGGRLAIYGSNSFREAVTPKLSIADSTGHFRIVPRSSPKPLDSDEDKMLVAYVDYNPLQGCHHYHYDEVIEEAWLTGTPRESQPAYIRLDGWEPGLGSPWCNLLPPISSLMDQFLDEGPVEEFEYGLWHVWRAKVLNNIDHSFWGTLTAKAYVTMSTEYGHSNHIALTGDAPKIVLIEKSHLHYGSVALSQAKSEYIYLQNPTEETIDAELVVGIPVGSPCANRIEDEFDKFSVANGTDWLQIAQKAFGIKCRGTASESVYKNEYIQRIRSYGDEEGDGAFQIQGKKRSMRLKPGESGKLGPIVFKPMVAGEYKSTIYVRSLLGGLEAINLYGTGNIGSLAIVPAAELENDITKEMQCFEDSKSGELQCMPKIDPWSKTLKKYDDLLANLAADGPDLGPLLSVPQKVQFQYNSNEVQANSMNGTSMAAFTKELFIVNVGYVPLYLNDYGIDGGCEGHGFSLVDCKGKTAVVLPPGTFHRFSINIQTDCSSSWSQSNLFVEAHLGMTKTAVESGAHMTLSTPLQVHVSRAVLPECSKAYIRWQFGNKSVLFNALAVLSLVLVSGVVFFEFQRYKSLARPLVVLQKLEVLEAVEKQLEVVKPPVKAIERPANGNEKPVNVVKNNPVNEIEKPTSVNATGDKVGANVSGAEAKKPSKVVAASSGNTAKQSSNIAVVPTQKTTTKAVPVKKKIPSKNSTVPETVQETGNKESKEDGVKTASSGVQDAVVMTTAKDIPASKSLPVQRKRAEMKRGENAAQKKSQAQSKNLPKDSASIAKKEVEEKSVRASKKTDLPYVPNDASSKATQSKPKEQTNDKAARLARAAEDGAKARALVLANKQRRRELADAKKKKKMERKNSKPEKDDNSEMKRELEALREEAKMLREKNEKAEEELRNRAKAATRKKGPVRPPPGFGEEDPPQIPNMNGIYGGISRAQAPPGFSSPNDIPSYGDLNMINKGSPYQSANDSFAIDLTGQRSRGRSGSGSRVAPFGGVGAQENALSDDSFMNNPLASGFDLNPSSSIDQNSNVDNGNLASFSAFGGGSSWIGGGSQIQNEPNNGMFSFLSSNGGNSSSQSNPSSGFGSSRGIDSLVPPQPHRTARLGSLNADIMAADDDDDEEILLMAGNANFNSQFGGFGNAFDSNTNTDGKTGGW